MHVLAKLVTIASKALDSTFGGRYIRPRGVWTMVPPTSVRNRIPGKSLLSIFLRSGVTCDTPFLCPLSVSFAFPCDLLVQVDSSEDTV